ncbi:MAG TPA: response regulator [Gemmataceae bacterium]|jgi:PAS domain S-box-containing protein|nr:response regulator [Gemmataceae bacterium]
MTDALKLFLIEDMPEEALLIRRSLEQAGHQVTVCRTGADALIVLGQSPFDLVILDNKLPDMVGLDLLHTLAREGIAVPVLMVTARGNEQVAADVLRAGALDYIVKDHRLDFLVDLPKRVTESVTRYRLEQTNRLLIQALESARDGIMITDLQGTILEVNRALEDLTGYSREELLGQTPRMLKSGTHPAEVYAAIWRAVLARRSWQGELSNRRKDGSLFQASLTISPIVDHQGRLTHFVGIQRDVSEHKALERQLLQAQKMQSVGTLAGGVAHEFNNLLAGINGYAALGLREGGLSPTLRQFLEHVVDLSERAAGLTRQLLAFARKPALSRQRTSMVNLVRGTAELVQRTLHQEVVVDVAEGAEESLLVVEADGNQLQQALVNLALNARDAVRERPAPPGEQPPPITFRLRHAVPTAEQPGFPQRVPPGDYVVLEVQDQGTGMTPEVLNQALDPFFTTKEVGQGTGLGLPMVFGIVQGHQGFLTIDTARGVGTRIGLYLPRLADAPDGDRTPLYRDAEVLEPEPTAGRAILVIDDEEAVLDVVCRFLQIAGHRVTCASSGQQALEQLTNGRQADLIILDLMMPREDAATTFQRLRLRRPGVPVLLCTGLPQADPVPELLRTGGVGLIRKPFRMNELWYAVKQALATAPAPPA